MELESLSSYQFLSLVYMPLKFSRNQLCAVSFWGFFSKAHIHGVNICFPINRSVSSGRSAVCSFRLTDIKSVFSGNYKVLNRDTLQWRTRVQEKVANPGEVNSIFFMSWKNRDCWFTPNRNVIVPNLIWYHRKILSQTYNATLAFILTRSQTSILLPRQTWNPTC